MEVPIYITLEGNKKDLVNLIITNVLIYISLRFAVSPICGFFTCLDDLTYWIDRSDPIFRTLVCSKNNWLSIIWLLNPINWKFFIICTCDLTAICLCLWIHLYLFPFFLLLYQLIFDPNQDNDNIFFSKKLNEIWLSVGSISGTSKYVRNCSSYTNNNYSLCPNYIDLFFFFEVFFSLMLVSLF